VIEKFDEAMFSTALTIIDNNNNNNSNNNNNNNKTEQCKVRGKQDTLASSIDEWDALYESSFTVDYISAFVLSCLHSGRTSDQILKHAFFMVPEGLSDYIAREIKSLSQVEPYGVRGCTIVIAFQQCKTKTCRHLGRFPIDRSTVSTFEISLCFKEDSFRSRLWPLRTWLMLLQGRRQTASVSAAAAAAKEDAVDARQHTAAVDDDEDFATRFTGGLVIDKFVEIHKKKYFRNLR